MPVMDVERFGANYGQYAPSGILRLKNGVRTLNATSRNGDSSASGRSPHSQSFRRQPAKVIIARWLQSGARIFLFDEPTRGIDVGAKFEIHELMRRLAKEGCAILVISSELPEVMAVSDRIGVMRGGRLVQTIDDCSGLTEDLLMKYASGEIKTV